MNPIYCGFISVQASLKLIKMPDYAIRNYSSAFASHYCLARAELHTSLAVVILVGFITSQPCLDSCAVYTLVLSKQILQVQY